MIIFLIIIIDLVMVTSSLSSDGDKLWCNEVSSCIFYLFRLDFWPLIASSLSLPAISLFLHPHQNNCQHQKLISSYNTVEGQSPIKVHKKELFHHHQLALTQPPAAVLDQRKKTFISQLVGISLKLRISQPCKLINMLGCNIFAK